MSPVIISKRSTPFFVSMELLRAICARGPQCPVVGDLSCEEGSQCCVKAALKTALQTVFKHDDFRPGQLAATVAATHGRDVFVRMATGAGKSLCLFLGPLSVSDSAMGIIVSPLVGLMDQQVDLLNSVGVAATRAGSENYSDVCEGKFRFVFMSPESAVKPPWCTLYTTPHGKKNIVLVAVDEAHCIEEWGKDFRIAFSKLYGLRIITSIPFMALTAPETQKLISQSLQLVDPVVVSCSLNRANIYLSASPMKGYRTDLTGISHWLRTLPPASVPKTVIFVRTKNVGCKVFSFLTDHVPTKSAIGFYHASLTQTTKSHLVSMFREQSNLRCLIATVAFGMGIDICDIKVVIVYGAPDSINQLYQLFGHAGRGGVPSRAHVFLSSSQKCDEVVKEYCLSKENCRRCMIMHALGAVESHPERFPCCDSCDNSKCPQSLKFDSDISITRTRQKRRSAVRSVDEDWKATLKSAFSKAVDDYIESHPAFRMLGRSFVCPNCVTDRVCDEARFVRSVDDLNIVGIRPELKDNFYNIVCNLMSSIPCHKKGHRLFSCMFIRKFINMYV